MKIKKVIISLAVGTLISGAALYLAFRNVPLDELMNYLKSINYFWVFPSVVLALVSFVFRAFRWQMILSSIHEVSFKAAFHPLMIGFMLNCILPGRVGEVARPVILQKNERVSFSAGFATVAIERVFDLTLLLLMFVVVFATVTIDPSLDMTFGQLHLNRKTLETVGAGMITISIVLICGILLISLPKFQNGVKTLILKSPSLFFFAGTHFKEKIRNRISVPLAHIVDNFASGFSLIKYPKKICICVGYSILVWSFQAVSYYVISLGCPGIGLSLAEITAVMVIVCFIIALPSVPGFWGLWEAGGVFALSLFGVASKDAAGYSLTNHAVQVFPVIIVGLVSAMLTGVNIWQISSDREISHDNT